MERCLREEHVTKAIIAWLDENSWKIVCFDFPQSGTGRVLHPNIRLGSKNEGAVIPDIIAVREGSVIFCENKDRFYLNDFIKLEDIRRENNYSNSLRKLLSGYEYNSIYYGVGLPITPKNIEKVNANKDRIDFIIDSNGSDTLVHFQSQEIF